MAQFRKHHENFGAQCANTTEYSNIDAFKTNKNVKHDVTNERNRKCCCWDFPISYKITFWGPAQKRGVGQIIYKIKLVEYFTSSG